MGEILIRRILHAALVLCATASLSACATHPPGTDLFGRPIDQAQHQEEQARAEAAARANSANSSTSSTPNQPVDLLRSVELRTPGATPAWSPAPVVTNARLVEGRSYTVQPGDTLRGIGNRTGAGSEALARANMLEPPYALRPGQQLTIPAGRYHEVQAGQTGIAIARAYHVDWGQVVTDNALEPPYTLRVGQRLRLPAGAVSGGASGGGASGGGAPAAPASMEEQAQAFTLDIDDIMNGGRPATRAASPAATASNSAATRAPSSTASAPTRFAWPLEGRILQRFGPAGNGRVNDGINIAATVGAPVRATAAGNVAYAGNEIGLFGGLILIDHGGGWVSAYGHLDRVAVRSGQNVAAGAIIATAGESGQVQTPQLHFELRQNRRPVDPLRQLPAR
jgi:murein DD-endopeptidase MepM/ murein hydrolase activator NlpD